MFGLGIWDLVFGLIGLAALYIWWRVMKYFFKKIFSTKSTETNDDVSKE